MLALSGVSCSVSFIRVKSGERRSKRKHRADPPLLARCTESCRCTCPCLLSILSRHLRHQPPCPTNHASIGAGPALSRTCLNRPRLPFVPRCSPGPVRPDLLSRFRSCHCGRRCRSVALSLLASQARAFNGPDVLPHAVPPCCFRRRGPHHCTPLVGRPVTFPVPLARHRFVQVRHAAERRHTRSPGPGPPRVPREGGTTSLRGISLLRASRDTDARTRRNTGRECRQSAEREPQRPGERGRMESRGASGPAAAATMLRIPQSRRGSRIVTASTDSCSRRCGDGSKSVRYHTPG
ncbi:hypothetical protein ERJ75_000377800 [Trypanosoma vivax]|nr:hypothetical protein ERJ75_000377800 [Trypanosoma vivax]